MGARKNGHTRGRHARGDGTEGPRKSFQLAYCECRYFQLVEWFPREKVTAVGEKTVNQQYIDNVGKVLYYTTSS